MRKLLPFAVLLAITIGAFTLWVLYSPWPDPKPEPVPWEPDAIVVLGGGDTTRANRAARLAAAFPEAAVLVTGDGGHLENLLRADPATRDRLVIEPHADSTWENAVFSEPILEQVHASRAVIVTNWFHAPRAQAVFRRRIPGVEFVTVFPTRPQPIPPWDLACHRREKLAALWYLLRYGVRSF